MKLDHSLISEWERLGVSCGARALHVELIKRYNGGNNGRVYLPTREAAQSLSVTRNTVSRYFAELEALGFTVETRGPSLGVEGKGRAAEWRLTHLPCDDRPPTLDYRNAEPLRKNRAGLAQKASQGSPAGKAKPAQKSGQAERNSRLKNRANLTSSHGPRASEPQRRAANGHASAGASLTITEQPNPPQLFNGTKGRKA
ncbi:hypothetical protein [Rhodovulum sp. YNF3179]|uniref:hypothetical protein n=1 Tax=Rhodovulum sp. YNF3179 TaxID=3425127 RepID=UPI003D33BA3C